MEEAKSLLEIIKSFLAERDYNISNDINEEELYRLAKYNTVSNFLQNWAEKDCKTESIKNKIYEDYTAQIVRDTNQNIELENVLNELEKNNIKTLVVKGILMKDLYPQNYMRYMCDIDILVDSKDFNNTRKIIESMGYKKFYNYEKHLIFTKEPFIMIEVHRTLVLKRDIGYDYLKDVWPLSVNYKEYKNIYQLSKEDAYIFCILHLLLHFKITGITIKDILDVYLYNETYKDDLDYNKLNRVFEELDIKEFEENIKKIAYRWFGTENFEDFDDVEKYILKGINNQNKINYDLGNSTGKSDYVRKLFFPKMNIMKEKYPVLEKAPVLLPAMWVARIFKDIFSKVYSVKDRVKTLQQIKETSSEEVEQVREIYKKLGIK